MAYQTLRMTPWGIELLQHTLDAQWAEWQNFFHTSIFDSLYFEALWPLETHSISLEKSKTPKRYFYETVTILE